MNNLAAVSFVYRSGARQVITVLVNDLVLPGKYQTQEALNWYNAGLMDMLVTLIVVTTFVNRPVEGMSIVLV